MGVESLYKTRGNSHASYYQSRYQTQSRFAQTKAMFPQTNGICERFHKTILNEFYQVTFRKKLHGNLDTLQSDLDEWLAHYNNERTHQGKMCNGRTLMETLLDGKRIWAEKNLSQM